MPVFNAFLSRLASRDLPNYPLIALPKGRLIATQAMRGG
jgi:hypothetical protein